MAKKTTKKRSKSSTKKTTFSTREFVLYILVFALVGAFTLWISLAAPHKTTGVTISLISPPTTDNNGDGLPNWGDKVNFNVSTNVDQTYVNLQCFQNGVFVGEGWHGFWPGALDYGWSFGLGSPQWNSGAADCTAYVKHYTGHGKNPYIVQAATTFHVNP
jgi:hypothetical protein